MCGAATFSPDPWNASVVFSIILSLINQKTQLAVVTVGFETTSDFTACAECALLTRHSDV